MVRKTSMRAGSGLFLTVGHLLSLVLAADDKVVASFAKLEDLTPWNFDDVIGGEKAVLAMFYAPWCGGCKKYMPKYGETAMMLRTVPKLAVMKADVTEFEYEQLKEDLNVSNVPAVKLFKKNDDTPHTVVPEEPWEMHFKIKERLGLPVPNKCLFGDSDAQDLTSQTWDATIMDPKITSLVEFYAPWCPHCKGFTSTYNNIARKAMNLPGIKVVRVDVDKEKQLGKRYQVKTLPTLMIFTKRNKTGTVYELPDAQEHLEMVTKILARLQEPEPDDQMEAAAAALLQRIQAAQTDRGTSAAVSEIMNGDQALNITEVWRRSIRPLRSELFEREATRIKDEAVEMAGAGKCEDALRLLDRLKQVYTDTTIAQSESVENMAHNCKAQLNGVSS